MKRILIITDEKKSSLNQCMALTGYLEKNQKVKIEYLTIKKKIIHFLTNFLILIFLNLNNYLKKIKVNYCDLIISCGRISAPYSILIKKRNSCRNVHIFDPYLLRKSFDLIVLPSHDFKRVRNLNNTVRIFATLVDKKPIENNEKKKYQDLLRERKIVSCFVGGSGKSSNLTKEDALKLVKYVNKIKESVHIIYCLSRRTEQRVKQVILDNKKSTHLLYDYKEPNPYWYLIKYSEFFIVTQDSVSMISDCISTGKPVFIHEVKKLKNKIKNFSLILKKKNVIKFFYGRLSFWSYKPINEASRVSNVVQSIL